MEQIKNWLLKIKLWYVRKKAIRNLRSQNLYMIEVEKIMEQFATHRILSGSDADARNQSRQVLLKHQQTIQVKSDFQEFLDSVK